jgi:2-keto-3-deoxygluconate permease
MQIRIKRMIERVPGGMMIVPLLAGAMIHTFSPHLADFFGSFTGALFSGSLPILAVFYVCTGSTVSLRSMPHVVRRGGALMATKMILGIGAGALLGRLIGVQPIRSGWFTGLSTLAVVAAINDTNGGLYIALMNQYGDPVEAASYSVLALESGPFFTMVTLGVAGLSSFPWQALMGAVLPLILGMILGTIDSELRKFLGAGIPVLIPFFAFALGATLNLKLVWTAGLIGVVLGLVVIALSGTLLVLVDRLIGGKGTAGMAAATTAGNAAAVPMLVAAANHKYDEAARPATVLVTASVIVTAVLVPMLTSWWSSRAVVSPVSTPEGAPPEVAVQEGMS